MLSFWEQLGLSLALSLMQKFIRTPAAAAGAEHIIVPIRDAACMAALAVDPNVAPPPGYLKA